MGLTLGAIVLNTKDLGVAAEFWKQALGYDASPDNPDFLVPTAGPATRLHLDETDRTHLDLWVDRTTSTLESEVDRLIGLGATRVEDWTYPPGADFVVLAAPDGTVFCVIN
ncbi:VOC family protein [Kribbella sp. NBC_01510]|uniref:VOC family protein n=1 Tax=Kribbella sp. NBC_01510 TaxID=2903581 RepID=UPI00386C0E35